MRRTSTDSSLWSLSDQSCALELIDIVPVPLSLWWSRLNACHNKKQFPVSKHAPSLTSSPNNVQHTKAGVTGSMCEASDTASGAGFWWLFHEFPNSGTSKAAVVPLVPPLMSEESKDTAKRSGPAPVRLLFSVLFHLSESCFLQTDKSLLVFFIQSLIRFGTVYTFLFLSPSLSATVELY